MGLLYPQPGVPVLLDGLLAYRRVPVLVVRCIGEVSVRPLLLPVLAAARIIVPAFVLLAHCVATVPVDQYSVQMSCVTRRGLRVMSH